MLIVTKAGTVAPSSSRVPTLESASSQLANSDPCFCWAPLMTGPWADGVWRLLLVHGLIDEFTG
jgi:hypothetical protein